MIVHLNRICPGIQFPTGLAALGKKSIRYNQLNMLYMLSWICTYIILVYITKDNEMVCPAVWYSGLETLRFFVYVKTSRRPWHHLRDCGRLYVWCQQQITWQMQMEWFQIAHLCRFVNWLDINLKYKKYNILLYHNDTDFLINNTYLTNIFVICI